MRRLLGFQVAVGGVATAAVVAVDATAAHADVLAPVKQLISSPLGWAWDKVTSGIVGWVLGGVADLVHAVITALGQTTAVDVHAVWFSGPGSPFATVRTIAGGLLGVLLVLAIVQALVAGDPGLMLRQVGVALPLAIFGMVVVTTMVGQLLALTDSLAAGVLISQTGAATRFLDGFATSAVSLTGGFAAALLGMVAVVATLVLWVELVVRAALVYLLVAVSPLAFAASVWPAARGVLRRTVELIVAVVVSKLVIAIALAVGVAAVGGAGSVDGIDRGLGTLLSGTVIVGLAAFAPFLVLRLVPAAEAALVAHGISRMPMRSAERGVALGMTGASVARLATASTSSVGPAATPATPSSVGVESSPGQPGAGGGDAGRRARAIATQVQQPAADSPPTSERRRP